MLKSSLQTLVLVVRKGLKNNISKTILQFGNKSLPSHPANDEKGKKTVTESSLESNKKGVTVKAGRSGSSPHASQSLSVERPDGQCSLKDWEK